ncbi:MAG: hypothetical protein LQ339_006092 [Xanthoria mediterranea]|nr:MAG: hypothetical protein LQ339_006092 [Xanthoria mediterranea]
MATLSLALPTARSSTAIVIPRKTDALFFSHDDLNAHVIQFQQKLARLGIGPKSAVSIALPNSYEFIVAFLATTRQRAIAAPLNPAYKQDEFEFYIDDLRSAVVLVPRDFHFQNGPAIRAARKHQAAIAECFWDGRDVVLNVKDPGKLANKRREDLCEARPNDIALVLHTSGTTGRPKAVPLTHLNLTTTMRNIKETYQLSPEDRTYLVMPLFHVHGLLAGFLAPLHSEGSVVAPARFSASEFWADFTTYKANWYTAVPTIHQILLRSPLPSKLPVIRFIRSCSSPLPPQTFHDLEKAFNAPVVEAYAMTEGAHQMTSNPLPPLKRYPGSVGIGWGVDVKILDQDGNEVPQGSEGEICIRGENVTKGYLNNPEANRSSFTAEGFFKTGDQGIQDQNGYIVITGRIKEIINKGGEKISPVEIDNVITRHPAVAEAVTFAIPDDLYGQDVGVAVVLHEGAWASKDELRQWMATKMAKFKVAKQIYFAKIMPKTATGKVQRRKVADAMLEVERTKAKL